MSLPSDQEKAYLLRRSAAHRALADGSDDPSRAALHDRFARLYRERAEAADLVEDDQAGCIDLLGTREADIG